MTVTKRQMNTLRKLISGHKTIRYGILPAHVHQTDENHTNRMLVLAPVIADMVGLKANWKLLIAITLSHDLSELGMTQDITSFEQEYKDGAKNEKDRYEAQMQSELIAKHGSWLQELFDEYNSQNSDAAKFVKWLDKYEASRHMLEIVKYDNLTHEAGMNHKHFFVNTQRLIKATLALPIMYSFTKDHIELEIKPIFKKEGKEDEYNKLVVMLG